MDWLCDRSCGLDPVMWELPVAAPLFCWESFCDCDDGRDWVPAGDWEDGFGMTFSKACLYDARMLHKPDTTAIEGEKNSLYTTGPGGMTIRIWGWSVGSVIADENKLK